MEEPSINVLVDAKTEYTKQLTNTLAPLIKEGFDSLYEDACKFKEDTNDPRYDDYSELQIFQDYLRKIPKWNQSIIDDETNRIIEKSRCEWLEDLLAAVFISNAKVLSVIRLKNPSHQMKLKIPKLRNFIHKCYVECSREIYQNVYLFDNEDISTIEKQKNVRDIVNIVKDGVVESVRKLLPVREIIRTYLGKIYDDEDTENTTIETGFEQNLFMDFAKKNLRNNVEEIHSDTEMPEQNLNDTISSSHSDADNNEDSQSSFTEDSEEEPIQNNEMQSQNNLPIIEDRNQEVEPVEMQFGEQEQQNNSQNNVEEKENEEDNEEEEKDNLVEQVVEQYNNKDVRDEVQLSNSGEEDISQPEVTENINLMKFLPKKVEVEEKPQISEEMIRKIEEDVATPRIVMEKKDEDTHFEEVKQYKTILDKEEMQKNENENTLSSTDENVKKIVINREETDMQKMEKEMLRAKEERRREKEERRMRKKILRNKHKKESEKRLEEPMKINDNGFMFVQGGAEYQEDI